MSSRIFYDAEFTGLHQSTSLISLALCAEDGREFYAEFSDFDRAQCDDWVREHVLSLTRWCNQPDAVPFVRQEGQLRLCFGDRAFVRKALLEWLSAFEQIQIWADCLAWDWVLFCELFGGALALPQQIFYMPFDLLMLFKCKGLDPDTPRLAFARKQGAQLPENQLHNALFDARLARVCYDLLTDRMD